MPPNLLPSARLSHALRPRVLRAAPFPHRPASNPCPVPLHPPLPASPRHTTPSRFPRHHAPPRPSPRGASPLDPGLGPADGASYQLWALTCTLIEWNEMLRFESGGTLIKAALNHSIAFFSVLSLQLFCSGPVGLNSFVTGAPLPLDYDVIISVVDVNTSVAEVKWVELWCKQTRSLASSSAPLSVGERASGRRDAGRLGGGGGGRLPRARRVYIARPRVFSSSAGRGVAAPAVAEAVTAAAAVVGPGRTIASSPVQPLADISDLCPVYGTPECGRTFALPVPEMLASHRDRKPWGGGKEGVSATEYSRRHIDPSNEKSVWTESHLAIVLLLFVYQGSSKLFIATSFLQRFTQYLTFFCTSVNKSNYQSHRPTGEGGLSNHTPNECFAEPQGHSEDGKLQFQKNENGWQ
ncbi:Protein of unknown function [Gryllus bimaculatus]|nr:Protein of unknown function [Gryllus bimaculatus]